MIHIFIIFIFFISTETALAQISIPSEPEVVKEKVLTLYNDQYLPCKQDLENCLKTISPELSNLTKSIVSVEEYILSKQVGMYKAMSSKFVEETLFMDRNGPLENPKIQKLELKVWRLSKLVEELKKAINDCQSGNTDEFLRKNEEGFTDQILTEETRIITFSEFHHRQEDTESIIRLLTATNTKMQRNGKKLKIFMEMFDSANQSHINDFLAGKIDEKTLLDEVNYNTTWGWPPAKYLKF